jgi:hypothetical protein
MLIDEALAIEMKLTVCGEEEVHGAHGYGKLRKYEAKLALPVVDSTGTALGLGIPTECLGVPHLSERYAREGISVVGILGRNFLQFCTLEINGLSGQVVIRIDQSALFPR